MRPVIVLTALAAVATALTGPRLGPMNKQHDLKPRENERVDARDFHVALAPDQKTKRED